MFEIIPHPYLEVYKVDLVSLTFIPESLPYSFSISWRASPSLSEPKQSKITSSINNRWDRDSRLPTFTPCTILNLLASIMYLLRSSATKTNRYGDNEHLCLIHPTSLKNCDAGPFIRIKKEVDIVIRTSHINLKSRFGLHYMLLDIVIFSLWSSKSCNLKLCGLWNFNYHLNRKISCPQIDGNDTEFILTSFIQLLAFKAV